MEPQSFRSGQAEDSLRWSKIHPVPLLPVTKNLNSLIDIYYFRVRYVIGNLNAKNFLNENKEKFNNATEIPYWF